MSQWTLPRPLILVLNLMKLLFSNCTICTRFSIILLVLNIMNNLIYYIQMSEFVLSFPSLVLSYDIFQNLYFVFYFSYSVLQLLLYIQNSEFVLGFPLLNNMKLSYSIQMLEFVLGFSFLIHSYEMETLIIQNFYLVFQGSA